MMGNLFFLIQMTQCARHYCILFKLTQHEGADRQNGESKLYNGTVLLYFA